MRKNRNALRNFVTAMTVTLLSAAAVGGVLLALARMESTMNADHYTAFSLERKSKDVFSLTALDQPYTIDLSRVQSMSDKLSPIAKMSPPYLTGFISAVEHFVDWLARLFGG